MRGEKQLRKPAILLPSKQIDYLIDDGFMQDQSDDDILWIPDFRKDIPFPEPFSDPDPVFLSIKHR